MDPRLMVWEFFWASRQGRGRYQSVFCQPAKYMLQRFSPAANAYSPSLEVPCFKTSFFRCFKVKEFAMSRKMAMLKKGVALFTVLCVVMVCGLILGCDTDGGDTSSNSTTADSKLIGTWYFAGTGWYNEYRITATTFSYDGGGYGGFTDRPIEYVFYFDKTKAAGFIVYKDNDGNYDAAYFKDLTNTTIIMGTAYDTTKNWETESTSAAVATLNEAKTRFIDRAKYGGDLGAAAVLTRQ